MEAVDPKKDFSPIKGRHHEQVKGDLPSSSGNQEERQGGENRYGKIEDKVELSKDISSKLPIGDPEVKISPLEMKKYTQLLMQEDFEEEIAEMQKHLPKGEEAGLTSLEQDLLG